ncbi:MULTISPECIES: WhiB family transcriptional regulator [Arthrobacter]|uniref:WhiB family transcriptional regulator n=1 Tax=unclassified Arthrobacter TaxID=235627 RepID=UPI0024B98B93|nr:WhiB family transcriptional regulator [Arthrobacter sp. H35-MC1]MDJ0317194.1 WhiB family transcriptional regulator [Arthrobacter sp. H35-MC1]
MGQAQLSVAKLQNDSVETQGGTAQLSRGVPTDWYVDPADPGAAAFHERENAQTREDAATAFLTLHEDDELAVAQLAPVQGLDNEPIWIGLHPKLEDFSDEGELGWQTDALCAQTDPEAFFPEKGGSTRDAKKVCGACNVKTQCLEYALANDERFGIWGGLSERERRRLRKRAV